ncbi:MAG: glycoside hydrolase family 99-like domain-containing protein [Planctomycetota bacterium]|nr:glycoside hydrolase family 99-like domain-containing protein [Planctomycetota bacterium]
MRTRSPFVYHRHLARVALAWLLACTASACGNAAEAGMADRAEIRVRSFLPEKPVCRARRPAPVAVVLENAGDNAADAQLKLTLPAGVKAVRGDASTTVRLEGAEEKKVVWELEADEAAQCELTLHVGIGDRTVATVALPMNFLAPVEIRKLPYIPEPLPVQTEILIGAHHCPLWEADKPNMWANLRKHPERTPALGFYAQENPQVSDWETKWAVEHGISFFIYCWYRTSQGGPVKTQFSSAIHDALFKSKFVDKMKFTIMWENQSRGTAGVADEKDLLTNLLPFWMENYFKHPSYLKVDNKPVLFIYRPEFLVQDLGGAQNVVKAFDLMRQACKDRGFAGLYILGEYRGLDPNHLKLMKQLGLDYTFAYCWHIQNNPTPEQAIKTQLEYIKKTQDLRILPQVVTVSQAWSGWRDEGSIWKIPPRDFESLLTKARDFIATLPPGELGSRMLLLDNWNEWGEGHYIAPYREYGFGYLDAVRKVFSKAQEPHVDLIPEDIGLGPYDTAIRTLMQREDEQRNLATKKVLKAGAPEDGLVGWWAFDEEQDCPVALDYSGHKLGGALHDAERAKGIDGNALVCKGGSVVVANNRLLSPTSALTVECWVKTDVAGQDNKWFVNRVFAGGEATGFRLGILEGKPCFEVPLTNWSHHLKASTPLPTGKWVHIAGTADGTVMRIYVDGEERGTMERPGQIKPNDFPLCLGSYEVKHAAYFAGLLDEVKLYSRALRAEEVREHFRKLADRAGTAPADGK